MLEKSPPVDKICAKPQQILNMKPFFIDAQGWLQAPDSRHLPSPHYNERPDGQDISLCVLHNISLPPLDFGSQYIDALFLGTLADDRHIHPYFDGIADLRVSTHFFIARNGAITQYVSTFKRAWHAGQSQYQGRENCNDFSLGIELNGADRIPYTLRQYQSCAQLIIAMHVRHPTFNLEHITHHSHIAPQRKSDPGPAWRQSYLQYLLRQQPSPTQ